MVRIVTRSGEVRWLGPETPFGNRPEVVDRVDAEVLSEADAGRALWAWRRSRAWTGAQASTEDVEEEAQ